MFIRILRFSFHILILKSIYYKRFGLKLQYGFSIFPETGL